MGRAFAPAGGSLFRDAVRLAELKPLAFAIVVPALYFPVLVIARGVAFEFRYRFWDHGFCYGSAIAAFAQGVMPGSYIQGFRIEGREFVFRGKVRHDIGYH